MISKLLTPIRLRNSKASARARRASWLLAAFAGFTLSGCSLIGEKEPAPLSTRLQSSTGCMDALGRYAREFWDGTLQEQELKASTQCMRKAFKTLDEQVEGTERKNSLTLAEFQTFLNTFIVPKTPVPSEVAQALLNLKSYILGGTPDRWEKTDTAHLLNWVDALEELGPGWAKEIGNLRTRATTEVWDELQSLSEQTETRLLAIEETNSSPRPLKRKDIEVLLDEFLDRIDQSDITSNSRALALDVLGQATRFFTGLPSLGGALAPETRTLVLKIGARSFPSLLGLSLSDDSIRNSELTSQALGSEASPEELQLNRQRHQAQFIRDLLSPLAGIASSTGESIALKEFLEWSKPWLDESTYARIRQWAPLLKEIGIGGSSEEFNRSDIQHVLQLLPSLGYAAMRPGKERWRPQVLISAYLSAWSRIRESESSASVPPAFSDSRILEAIHKLETLDPSYQLPESLSKSLPGALRLARYALEGTRNGATIEWERWLGLLRLAATLDGPLLDLQKNPSRKLSLIRLLLDRTIENTRCEKECIPLAELHGFLQDDFAGTPLADFGAFVTAKQFLLGGSESFVTLEDLRKVQDTLKRLSPNILEILAAQPGEVTSTFIRHLEPLLNEIARNHGDGIPIRVLDALDGQWFSGLMLDQAPEPGQPLLPSLPRLLVQTLSGAQIDAHATSISPTAWQTATRKLRQILSTVPAYSSEELKAFIDRSLENPASWRALRNEITTLPLAHPNHALPWTIIDAWIGYAAKAGWLPDSATPKEIMGLVHVALESMNRIQRRRDTPVTQSTLYRFLETSAQLAPQLRHLKQLASSMKERSASDPIGFWGELDREFTALQGVLKGLQILYPAGTGISLYSASRLVDQLPRQWLTLDRELIKNGIEPTFHRLWVCKQEEAFCPSGAIPLIDAIRVHIRGEKLAAEFSQANPDADEKLPPIELLQRMTDFGKSLGDPLEFETWSHWKSATANYPQVFQGDPEQALFTRSNGIYEANSRIFFHFERFCDFFMRAYDYTGASTPVAAAPIRLRQFIEMADDFDDLAKAFSALESRTPSMASTRFREAGLFSFHGDGDDLLTVQEFTGYFTLIWSAKTLVRKITQKLTPICETGDGKVDLINRPILKMPCFRTGFTIAYRDEFLKNLPGLAKDWSIWSEKQRERYINAMELTGREKGFGDDPIPYNDIDGIISLLQYLEALMLRFDDDQDGALDQAEVHRMFPKVRATIEAAVRKQGSDSIADDPEWLESLFTWVLTRKSLPQGPLPIGFVLWHGARNDRKFKIRRYDAMIAISVLLGADPK